MNDSSTKDGEFNDKSSKNIHQVSRNKRISEEERNKNIKALQTLLVLNKMRMEEKQTFTVKKIKKTTEVEKPKINKMIVDHKVSEKLETIENLWMECWYLWRNFKTPFLNNPNQTSLLQELGSKHLMLYRLLQNLSITEMEEDKLEAMEIKKNYSEVSFSLPSTYSKEPHKRKNDLLAEEKLLHKDKNLLFSVKESNRRNYSAHDTTEEQWNKINQQQEKLIEIVTQLQQQVNVLNQECFHPRTENENEAVFQLISQLKQKYKFCNKICNQVLIEMHNGVIPIHVHIHALEEFKMIMQQMQAVFSTEMDYMNEKLKDLGRENVHLFQEIQNIQTQKGQFEHENKSLKKLLKDQEQKRLMHETYYKEIAQQINFMGKTITTVRDVMMIIGAERNMYIKMVNRDISSKVPPGEMIQETECVGVN